MTQSSSLGGSGGFIIAKPITGPEDKVPWKTLYKPWESLSPKEKKSCSFPNSSSHSLKQFCLLRFCWQHYIKQALKYPLISISSGICPRSWDSSKSLFKQVNCWPGLESCLYLKLLYKESPRPTLQPGLQCEPTFEWMSCFTTGCSRWTQHHLSMFALRGHHFQVGSELSMSRHTFIYIKHFCL